MPRFSAALATPLLLLALAACHPAPKPEILATVGDQQITTDSFLAAARLRSGGNFAQLDKTALLEELITRSALLQQARTEKLDQDPAFRRELENLLLARLQAKHLDPLLEKAADIPDTELQRLYDSQPTRFTQPARRHLAILRLTTNPNNPEDQPAARLRLEEAARLASDLPPGTPGFGPISVTHSDDQDTRYQGGDTGWLIENTPSSLPQPVQDAAAQLTTPGTLTPPIETEAAIYLVKLIEHRPAARQPFPQVRPQLLREAALQADKTIRDTYANIARQAVKITTNPHALETLDLPPQDPSPSDSPPATP